MHFLGNAEKVRRPLDGAPASLDTDTVHEESERSKQLSYSPTIIGRIYVHYVDVRR